MRKPKAPQTNLDTRPRSQPTLELHSMATSSVGIMSPFQWSQYKKQFRRKADKKIIKQTEMFIFRCLQRAKPFQQCGLSMPQI